MLFSRGDKEDLQILKKDIKKQKTHKKRVEIKVKDQPKECREII